MNLNNRNQELDENDWIGYCSYILIIKQMIISASNPPPKFNPERELSININNFEHNCYYVNNIINMMLKSIARFEIGETLFYKNGYYQTSNSNDVSIKLSNILTYCIDRNSYVEYNENNKTHYNERNIFPVKMVEELEDGITLFELTDD
jgi:hypothetical protein